MDKVQVMTENRVKENEQKTFEKFEKWVKLNNNINLILIKFIIIFSIIFVKNKKKNKK
jgi:hypothetical protein